MPHDIKGRLIQVGDVVKATPVNNESRKVVGVVANVYVGAQTCSGNMRWLGIGKVEEALFSAEEAELVLKGDGTEVNDKEKEN